MITKKEVSRILSTVLAIFAGITGMFGDSQNAIVFILMAMWTLLASDRM